MDSIIQSICGISTIDPTTSAYLKIVVFCIMLDTILSMFNQLKS